MTSSASYLQICVPAPEQGLSGAVVAEWIQRVLAERDLGWVAASDVDIAGDSRRQLVATAREARVMLTSTFLSLLQRATQVVWATLFFCRTESEAGMIRPDETYEASTEKAVVTVRVVDATYVYIIGREDVLRGAERVLPPGESHLGAIEDMEFPE